MKLLLCLPRRTQHLPQVRAVLHVPLLRRLHCPLEGVKIALHLFQVEHGIVFVCVDLEETSVFVKREGSAFSHQKA